MHLMKISSADELKATYAELIKNTLDHGNMRRESLWTESVAVGSQEFVKRTAAALGIRSRGKKIIVLGGTWELREERLAYRHLFQP
jgi:putative transposase